MDENATEPAQQNSVLAFIDEKYFLFVFLVLGTVVLLPLVVCLLKEYLKRRFDIEICIGAGGLPASRTRRQVNPEQEQEQNNEQLGREIRRLSYQENRARKREANLETKKKERMEKYKILLKRNLVVVDAKQLFFTEGDVESGVIVSHHQKEGTPAQESNKESHTNNIILEDNLHLKLPVLANGDNGVSVDMPVQRHVSGSCAICIDPYQAGEKVIWSTNVDCKHAFHDECILTWLSKGKKRCPVCRHFFCPVVSSVVGQKTPKQLNED